MIQTQNQNAVAIMTEMWLNWHLVDRLKVKWNKAGFYWNIVNTGIWLLSIVAMRWSLQ